MYDSKLLQMGWCEEEDRCNKHSDHHQQPGVCSSCLRERLTQLSAGPFSLINTTMVSYSSSSSSLSSSPSHSSASSSTHASTDHRHHHRHASDVMGSIALVISGSSGLRRSRSLAVVAKTRAGDGSGGKKKGGFLWKLIGSTGKRTKEILMHSRKL